MGDKRLILSPYDDPQNAKASDTQLFQPPPPKFQVPAAQKKRSVVPKPTAVKALKKRTDRADTVKDMLVAVYGEHKAFDSMAEKLKEIGASVEGPLPGLH